jgi:hypothetical protein
MVNLDKNTKPKEDIFNQISNSRLVNFKRLLLPKEKLTLLLDNLRTPHTESQSRTSHKLLRVN